MSAPLPVDRLSPEKIAEIERRDSPGKSEAPGNVMLLLTTHLPDELAEKIKERDGLVGKLKALNLEIATMTTHVQLAEKS